MTRQISGLVWAKLLATRPRSIPQSRPRAKAKQAGLRYERAVALAIGGCVHGQWWEFCDRNGHGYCQTDVTIDTGKLLVVLESKYTWTPDAYVQLEGLYLPVLRHHFNSSRHVIGFQITKVLKDLRGCRVARSFDEACRMSMSGERVVLHWLGVGNLWPPQPNRALSHQIPVDTSLSSL